MPGLLCTASALATIARCPRTLSPAALPQPACALLRASAPLPTAAACRSQLALSLPASIEFDALGMTLMGDLTLDSLPSLGKLPEACAAAAAAAAAPAPARPPEPLAAAPAQLAAELVWQAQRAQHGPGAPRAAAAAPAQQPQQLLTVRAPSAPLVVGDEYIAADDFDMVLDQLFGGDNTAQAPVESKVSSRAGRPLGEMVTAMGRRGRFGALWLCARCAALRLPSAGGLGAQLPTVCCPSRLAPPALPPACSRTRAACVPPARCPCWATTQA